MTKSRGESNVLGWQTGVGTFNKNTVYLHFNWVSLNTVVESLFHLYFSTSVDTKQYSESMNAIRIM